MRGGNLVGEAPFVLPKHNLSKGNLVWEAPFVLPKHNLIKSNLVGASQRDAQK